MTTTDLPPSLLATLPGSAYTDPAVFALEQAKIFEADWFCAVRSADLRFSGNGLGLDNVDISLGQTAAHGNLVVNDFAAPSVQFSLSANHINVAEWDSVEAFRAVATQPEFQASLSRYPDSSVAPPHIFMKVAVPGVCGD